MSASREELIEFQRLVDEGSLQRAYRAVIGFMQQLRIDIDKSQADIGVSEIYQGYMDMTYFALFVPELWRRGLKVAIVFEYDPFEFEVWLSGKNRGVQKEYYEIIKDAEWGEYEVMEPGPGVDGILKADLAHGTALEDSEALADLLIERSLAFAGRVEEQLEALGR
jgi:hypothetical protein